MIPAVKRNMEKAAYNSKTAIMKALFMLLEILNLITDFLVRLIRNVQFVEYAFFYTAFPMKRYSFCAKAFVVETVIGSVYP